MSDHPRLLARLTRTLAGQPLAEPLPMRLCRAFVEIVGAERGAVSLGFSTTERSLLVATDDVAARYEEAQDLVREGPSLDAFRTGVAVWSSDAADTGRRWPQLTSAAPHAAPGRIHAIPMRADGTVIGVVTVHHGAGDRDGTPPEELQFLVDAVGAAIRGAVPREEPGEEFWRDRDRVSQATGMVIGQLGLTPSDAAAVLRAHAFALALPIAEIARRVLDRELDFSDDEAADQRGDRDMGEEEE